MATIAAPVNGKTVPQYIAMAFDGSKSLEMWQQSLDFAAANDIKFTYFVSGVYFLTDDNAGYYEGPRRNRGRSDIGFGGTVEEVAIRIAFVRRAYQEGHEIASHANGHWNGTNWSKDEWFDELDQFQDIMANTHKINGIPNTNKREWRRIVESITGFRAPLLAGGASMRAALSERGYTYDTSQTATRNYWPQKSASGLWNFPLASLPLGAGSVLSMDYNFYVLHRTSGSAPRTSMERAYRRYFNNNYNGVRAPMHIGHHFARWRSGAYWQALKNFSLEVCAGEDVVCGTYKGLEDLMGRVVFQ